MDHAPIISLRDLFAVLFKWQWIIVLALFTVAVLALAWLTLFRAPAYEVSAKLLVKIGNEQASPTTVVGQTLGNLSYRSYDVNSEVEILSSPALLGRLVDQFAMDSGEPEPAPEKLFPRIRYELRQSLEAFNEALNDLLIRIGFRERLSAREQVIFNLSQGLRVTPIRESYVIHVSLTLPTRQGSSIVLNKLIELYLSKRREIFLDKLAVDFFQQRVLLHERALAAAQDALRKIELEAGISDIEKQKEVLLDQVAMVRRDYTEAKIALNESTARLTRFEKILAGGLADLTNAGSFTPGSFPESIMLRISDLLLERERLRGEEGRGSKRSTTNMRQIGLLGDELLSNLQSEEKDRRAAFTQHERELNLLRSQLDAIKSREVEWYRVSREIRALEKTYMEQREKLEEAQMRSALMEQQAGNVVLIQPAIDPIIASGMRKSTLFVLVMIIATFGLFAWIVVAEFFDHRFYTQETLEAVLGKPVIGAIPFAKSLGLTAVTER